MFLDGKQLLRIAMADAYAAGVEFIEKSPNLEEEWVARALELRGYLQHPFYQDLPVGCYTDDTEMSVANAKVLIYHNYPFSAVQFTDAWLAEFKRGGKRKGYAGGFYDFLSSVRNGKEFLRKIMPDSDSNGAAMRAIPIGFLPDVNQVIESASLQASITHNTHAGLFSARAVALLSHFSLREESSYPLVSAIIATQDHLPAEDMEKYGYIFTKPWDGGPVSKRGGIPLAVTTVHAVIDLLSRNISLLNTMKQIIHWKGDTDSVAAIAWGVMSPHRQYEKLPDFFYQNLEVGRSATGTKYLQDIARHLVSKYK